MPAEDRVLEESMRLVNTDAETLRSIYQGQTDLLLSCWMHNFNYIPSEVTGPTQDRLLNTFLRFFGMPASHIRIFDTYDALVCCFYQYLDYTPDDIPAGTLDRILWMLHNSPEIPVQKPIRCNIAEDGHLYFYADTAIVPNFSAAYQEAQKNLQIKTDNPPISNVRKNGTRLGYDYTT